MVEAQNKPEPMHSVKGLNIRDWLNSSYNTTVDDLPGDECPDDLFEGVSDCPDDPIHLPPYNDVIHGSPAYSWLLAKLENQLLLAPAEPDHMRTISCTIMDSLCHGTFRNISRQKAPHLCDMTFLVGWNPMDFLQDQEYEESPEQALERAITITGTGRNAQALTTAQYLRQTWPMVGEDVLEVVKHVVKGGSSDVQSGKFADKLAFGQSGALTYDW